MRVTSLPIVLPGSGPVEIRTIDLLVRERTLYRYATQTGKRVK